MSRIEKRVNKQAATTNAPATIEENNTNVAEQPETLCTINGKEIHVGDTFRLNVDTTHGTAFIDVNPTDDAPGRDDCAAWREDVKECYKQLQLACRGLIVEASYFSDRREQVTTRGTIVGCGRDTNNNRCTFKVRRDDGTDTTPSCKYVWKVYGFNADYSGNGSRNTDSTPTAARTLASIQADIDKWEAKAKEATDKANKYKEERRKALEVEITAVKSTIELHPTTREALTLCANVPTADRIPQNVWQALQIMEKDNPVYGAMMERYDDTQIDFAECEETMPQLIANADTVLALMREKGLRVDDIPTEVLK